MSAGAAAGAAAAMARRKREEEESMTGYTPADLAGDWEFKILRSATGAFRHPERFREAVQQEASAGWVLIEKFDNQRLRFKRPVSARSGDATLANSGGAGGPGSGGGLDPYRTTYGMSETRLALTIMTCIFTTLGVAIWIIIMATRGAGHHTP